MKNSIKRLFWDIETSPNVVLSWRVGYKINIDHDNILNERAIICICYKWEGEKKVHSLHWDSKQNDKAMLVRFMRVANEADELVAHNGDRFDMAWVRTRCIYHGIQTFPEYKTIDTLKWAKRTFYFNSNRMDYLGKFLGVGGKIETNFGLWKAIVLKRDPKALREMVRYCKKDVTLLEEVWAELRKYSKHRTHAGVQQGGQAWSCPHCGSSRVMRNSVTYSATGTAKHRMYCKECGAFYTISDAQYKAFVAAKKEAA